MPHTTYNLDEVAEYLHVSRENIEMLARRNEIPCEKQGDRFIFLRTEVDAWASKRILGLDKDKLNDYHKGSSAKVHDLSDKHALVTEILHPDYIQEAMTSKTKASVIKDMIELADQTGMVIYRDEFVISLNERERMCSTALAGGIALLHPTHHDPYMFEDSFVVLGRTIQPVPFGSPDGQTTDIFFLVCCQDDRIHLHTLARICMMCHHTNLLMAIRESGTAEAVWEAIQEQELEVIGGL